MIAPFVDLRPRCGVVDCNATATHADSSGIGYCGRHAKANDADEITDKNPLDWWFALSTAAMALGGTTAQAWEDVVYGELPKRRR